MQGIYDMYMVTAHTMEFAVLFCVFIPVCLETASGISDEPEVILLYDSNLATLFFQNGCLQPYL